MYSFGFCILIHNRRDTEIPMKNRMERKSAVLDPAFLDASDYFM